MKTDREQTCGAKGPAGGRAGQALGLPQSWTGKALLPRYWHARHCPVMGRGGEGREGGQAHAQRKHPALRPSWVHVNGPPSVRLKMKKHAGYSVNTPIKLL